MKIPANDPLVKIGEAERILGKAFEKNSVPKRNTILGMLEDGTLKGVKLGKGKNNYIFQSSLEDLMRMLSDEKATA